MSATTEAIAAAPMSPDRGPISVPARAGVSLKPAHYENVLSAQPDIGWFEVHPENYMGAGGPPHHYLTRVRERYPLSLHGVGLSIGGESRPSRNHLRRLRHLVERYQPGLFSEHLAWSTHDNSYLNDLLPLPYTQATLARVVDHIDEIQEALGRCLLLENPSTYLSFEATEMEETEFLDAIAERTGCGLLLDVNNVLVSAVNGDFCAETYIDCFPVARVGEIHLGGHADALDANGRAYKIDTHDCTTIDPVWDLYRRALGRVGAVPTLIEWDSEIPPWETLHNEARRAGAILERATAAGRHDYAG